MEMICAAIGERLSKCEKNDARTRSAPASEAHRRTGDEQRFRDVQMVLELEELEKREEALILEMMELKMRRLREITLKKQLFKTTDCAVNVKVTL
jgi:hypothetical protein